jgi:hypothetical protein
MPLRGAPLDNMLHAARRRNRREGVTGLLVADGDHYLQWLEGPPSGVAALMRAISMDRRHDSIEILSEAPAATRCFAGWDMRLASDRGSARGCAALHVPAPLIETLWAQPADASGLLATLGLAPISAAEAMRQAILCGLGHDAAAEGAACVAPRRPPPVSDAALDRFLADLSDPAAPIEAITLPGGYRDVRGQFAVLVEPAARRLGDLWMKDALSEFDVTIALGRLQSLVRHLGRVDRAATMCTAAPAVLVAPMPGEPHGLGATLDSEWLWLAGWPHDVEIAETDAALQRLLQRDRFDLLDLSLSPAFERLDGAGALRGRLAAFRSASRNPALRIRLSGRLFAQQPWLAGLVGADAVSGTCHGLDATLLRLAGAAALG